MNSSAVIFSTIVDALSDSCWFGRVCTLSVGETAAKVAQDLIGGDGKGGSKEREVRVHDLK